MLGREIEVDVAGQASGGVVGFGRQPLAALTEHLADGGGDQVILGREVGIEAAVRQAGLGHHLGHPNLVRTVGADGVGRSAQHPAAGLLLVLGLVAHGLRPHQYDASSYYDAGSFHQGLP